MVSDARLLAPDHGDYPAGLTDLEVSPPIYVTGDLTEATGVAVVGTRRCTRYGSALARSFGSTLARSGWSVVSGLARGVDAAAHWGTLDGAGHAVGVLGSGLDVVYPVENRALYEAVRKTTQRKPVVVFTVGEANIGEFAVSHTGQLIGSYALKKTALTQANSGTRLILMICAGFQFSWGLPHIVINT